MRATSRLFATVRSASKYLEANSPTGLTGLTTHPSPRPALIYTYRQTLNKLAQLPKSSVYRQSTELSQNSAWRSSSTFSKFLNEDGSFGSEKLHVEPVDNWDGKITRRDAKYEGPNTMAQAETKARAVSDEVREKDLEDKEGIPPTVEDLEVEPPLTREQIEGIEQKIGAGLIEEVIQVAEGELELVDEMLRHQVWEDLEEKTPTGQWVYFERGERT
ncbi:ETC complex I subunit conserved domain-containing protein [Cladophialophora immunda]|nr:ETC complex I subunit conserved domain-containing protein [Cladophialophora immunda]